MFLKKDHFNGLLVIVVILSIVSGFLGGALTISMIGVNNSTQTSSYDSVKSDVKKTVYIEQSSIIDTVKKVSPAVVSIVVSKDMPIYRQGALDPNSFFFGDPFGDGFFNTPFTQPQYDTDGNGKVKTIPKKIGGGSGFIVTKDGLILTNKHVVDDTQADYTVVLNDGTEYPAEVVSRDTLNDIAVLKIKKPDGKKIGDLPVVALGNSSDLQVGQQVVAIGNALAEYENSVTMGVISAKGRNINAGNINGVESLINLLQTDASINPGNSGGPLVNLNGEVIGINVAIANGAQGIGFALPIDDVKPIIKSVIETGKIVRPFLGVRYILLDKQKADELKIPVDGGALLTGDEAKGEFAVIPGSPADKAGLKMKDVILEADGKKISATDNLQNLIASKTPGDKVSLKVWRSGKEMQIDVTLDEAK